MIKEDRKKIITSLFFWVILGVMLSIFLAPYISTSTSEVVSFTSLNSDAVCNKYYIGEEAGKVFILDNSAYFDVQVDGKFTGVTISVKPESLLWKDGGAKFELRLVAGSPNQNYEYEIEEISVENPTVTLKLPYKMKGEDWLRVIAVYANGYTCSIDNVTVFTENTIYAWKTFVSGFALASFIVLLFYIGIFITKTNRIEKSGILFYIFLSATSVFYLTCFISRGELLPSIFYFNPRGTFCDYITLVLQSLGMSPYDNDGNYPAFAYLIIEIFGMLIQRDYYGLGDDRKWIQATIISGYFFIFLAMSIILLVMNKKLLRIENENSRILFNFFFILSAPIAFTIERGNIIIWAFAFTLVFIAFYDSESKMVREVSYIALAMAFAIKLYPAIFGILLLRKRRWIDAMRTGLYGIVLLVFPFAKYGFRYGIGHFIKGILNTSASDPGMGDNLSVRNIVKTFSNIIGIDNYSTFLSIVIIILMLALIYLSFMHEEEHIALLAMSLITIAALPYSYFYTAIFLYIPFFSYMREYIKGSLEKNKRILTLGYAVLFVPVASPIICKLTVGYESYLSYYELIQYISITCMEIACIYISLRMIVQKAKIMRKRGKDV